MTNQDRWFYTANIHAVREFKDAELIYFKATMLDDATRDLEVIPTKLSHVLQPELHQQLHDTNPMLFDSPEMIAHFKDIDGPWHFKPAALKRTGPKAEKVAKSNRR